MQIHNDNLDMVFFEDILITYSNSWAKNLEPLKPVQQEDMCSPCM